MATLGNLVVNLVMDSKKFDSATKAAMSNAQRLSDKFAKVGQSLKRTGTKLSAFVTLPLVGLGVASVKAASDAEEMESKFNAVFKHLADDTKQWAVDFGESINRSEFDIMKWMATLQDTFVPLGFAREEGAKFSKTLVTLTTDMASFNNVAESDVLRDLQSALVGNHETVRKYGVIISQATLDQELLNMGIEGGVRAATEQQKVLARMNIILASTTDAQGDAARTADSFANKLRGLKAQFQKAAVAIGEQLIPVVSRLMEKVMGLLNWFNSLDDRQRKIIITIAAVVAAVGPMVLIAGQLSTALSALIPVVIATNAAMAANPVLAIVAAVALLATGTYLLIKNWDKVKEFFIGLWATMKDIFMKVKEWVDRVPNWVLLIMPFVTLPLLILKNWDQIKAFFIRLAEVIGEFVDKLFGFVKKIKEGTEKITGFFKKMFDKVAGNSYVPDMVDIII